MMIIEVHSHGPEGDLSDIQSVTVSKYEPDDDSDGEDDEDADGEEDGEDADGEIDGEDADGEEDGEDADGEVDGEDTDGEEDGEDEDSDSDGNDDESDAPFIEFEINMTDDYWIQQDLPNVTADTLNLSVGDKITVECPGTVSMQNSWGTMVLIDCAYEIQNGQTLTECTLDQTATWTTVLSLGLQANGLDSQNQGTCRLQAHDGSGDDDESNDEQGGNDDENDGPDGDDEHEYSGVDSYTHGAINIEVDEVPITVYIVSVEAWTGATYNRLSISEDENQFTLHGGGNFQLSTEHANIYKPHMFAGFTLLGKEFTYTVDRSSVGCSCNSALYTVSLPGYNANQEPDESTWGNYYCDANQVAGVWCPEMDISEANRFTMASVPHRCSQPDGLYYPECDRSGCGTNIFHENENAMCPNSDCIIDTTKPYTHSVAFEKSSNGKLSGIKNTLSQEGRSFEFYACSSQEYLEDMTEYLEEDMHMIFSQWGSTRDSMSWLDGMTECNEDCNLEAANTIYSNLKIKTIQSNGDDDQSGDDSENDDVAEEENDGENEEEDDENENNGQEHSGVGAYSHGAINIEIDDQMTQAYLVSVADWTSSSYNKMIISEDSTSFTLDGGGNFQLTTEDIDVYTPSSFAGFTLLGKEFEYTVDRSTVGCSCNSALYTVSMPGYDVDQQPDESSWGNYYCDANRVAGVWCPEMDISEANRFTMASVPHRCSDPHGLYYPECDRAGCGTKVFEENEMAMGPSEDFIIDTTKPYKHITAFETLADGKLSAIKNTLSQEDRSFEFYACGNQEYLEDMTDYLANDMAIVFSQWGSDRNSMYWLDGMTGCNDDCDLEAAKTIYSDLKIRTIQES